MLSQPSRAFAIRADHRPPVQQPHIFDGDRARLRRLPLIKPIATPAASELVRRAHSPLAAGRKPPRVGAWSTDRLQRGVDTIRGFATRSPIQQISDRHVMFTVTRARPAA
jgi:hypothetical protein